MVRFVLCCIFVSFFGLTQSHAQSPYVGQELRSIKSLSRQQISDYLSGKKMGLAKAAELNGFPGPAHVLELGMQLKLTQEQKAKSEVLFQTMQSRAIAIGKKLVEEERSLDKLFASRAVTVPLLASSLDRIGRLQGQLRQVHLEAHLEQTTLLTQHQIAKYSELRGYIASGRHGGHENRRH